MGNIADRDDTGASGTSTSPRAGCYRKRSSTHARSPGGTDTDAACGLRQMAALVPEPQFSGVGS
ncbi:hypothetical protein CGRA01v4_05283 [Colletotrichum graminicola]|nr:hypothetical protein CGRA01v4_05283 [Colletotrichum graminicola]